MTEKPIKVVCRKGGSTVTNFTDGKVYEQVASQGNLIGILDDLGRLRFILPNEKSPHLVREFKAKNYPWVDQESVGLFEVVND